MTDDTDTRPALPPGWAWATVDDFADHCLGKMLDKGKKRPGKPLPYLRNINVRWGRFDLGELLEMPFEAGELDRYGIEDGDILVCEGGEPGRCAVWRAGPTEIKLQKALHRLRCFDSILPEYIAYQIQYLAAGPALEQFFTGTTIKHLPGVALKKVPYRIAPIEEQRRIVARIEELFGEIEAGEQELEKANEGLSALRSAMLNAAVTGQLTRAWREANPPDETGEDLLRKCLSERRKAWERNELAKLKAKGEVPKENAWKARYVEPIAPDTTKLPALPTGWVWATLDQCTVFKGNGISIPPRNDPPGIPILRISAVRPLFVDSDDYRYLANTEATGAEKFHAHPGDLLFTRYNGSPSFVGVCGILRSKRAIIYPDKIMRAQPIVRKSRVSDCIELFINCGHSRSFVKSRISTSAGQHGISGSSLRMTPIPLPPYSEIEVIINSLSTLFEQLSEGESYIETQSKAATRLRQSILAAAFSGKLVPQDPNDEPAEALLARLRAAKAGAPAPKRRGRPPAKAATADAVTRPAGRPRGRPRKTPAKETPA
ncbi:restriction endonuclease subunit S [Azospirillum lipoferum]|uniref:Restriction modification system, DNA specificity subunit n=1 Tax=Azospirillum lipoferum (strain 4B) TaxID=862719 RepID=G7Z8K2_AZOL4|nr:restriction endonuclease subunit S [Azospirillum lipoferum]CBS87296.1 Restriction modification system, DNA specificity subunit [Azospirillum lipoferum 4B]